MYKIKGVVVNLQPPPNAIPRTAPVCGTIDIIIYLLYIETHCLTTPPVVHQTYCLVFVVEKQNMKYLPTKLN